MNETSLFSDPKIQKRIILILLIVLSVGVLILIRNFLAALFAGAIFTALTWPLYSFVLQKVKKPSLAAMMTLFLLCLFLGIPIMVIGLLAWKEAIQLLSILDLRVLGSHTLAGLEHNIRHPPAWIPDVVKQYIEEQTSPEGLILIKAKFAEIFKGAVEFMFYGGARFSASLLNAIITFFLTLFCMFYFYLDGPWLWQKVLSLSPIDKKYQIRIAEKLLMATKTTLKGSVFIGFLQGSLGSVMLWVLGMNSPVFWGLVMVVASVIPAVGVGLVLVPMAIYLLIKGLWIKALILLVATGIIGLIDNLIRPVIVGRDLKMHDLMVLFSTLGGIGLFGLSGVVLGPMIAAVFMTLLEIYVEAIHPEQKTPTHTA